MINDFDMNVLDQVAEGLDRTLDITDLFISTELLKDFRMVIRKLKGLKDFGMLIKKLNELIK